MDKDVFLNGCIYSKSLHHKNNINKKHSHTQTYFVNFKHLLPVYMLQITSDKKERPARKLGAHKALLSTLSGINLMVPNIYRARGIICVWGTFNIAFVFPYSRGVSIQIRYP